MGFWIFMLIVNLFIPFTMIGFGQRFAKKAPKMINTVFGYRTSMSMKNKDTWDFAHHYCGKLWNLTGWFILVCSVIAMFAIIGTDMMFIAKFGIVITVVQCIFMIIPIFPTEIALKRKFDKEGNPRL